MYTFLDMASAILYISPMSNYSYIRDAMGYKERSTYVELIVGVGVFIWYLVNIFGRLQTATFADVSFQRPMITAVVISIVATIVLHIVASILTGNSDTREDQRDRQIARFGDWAGIFPLSAGAGTALVLAMLELDHFWIANAIYAGFFISSVTAAITTLVTYRRGLAGA